LPLPLIPVIVGIVLLFAGGTAAIVIPKLAKKLAGKRVAILGGQKVGKTTLLHILRDGRVPKRASHTVDPALGGRFVMEVGGKEIDFDVPNDLPGHHNFGLSHWEAAFAGADYVWYLFRSDLIAQGDPSEIRKVKDHLDLFKDWMGSGVSTLPKVILIGTWADQAPGYTEDFAKFIGDIGGNFPIKHGAIKLNNADLVVGSLVTNKDSKVLIKSLRSYL
tara:strand:- start:5130 stop:5786 length:657 start_codon:yes stop_codon:yes gene_type:complete